MKPGDIVFIKSREKSAKKFELVVLQVDRSAPRKPYYCYNEFFDFGDWFDESDLKPYKESN